MSIALSLVTTTISLVFASVVGSQYVSRSRPHQLVWSMALLIFVGADVVSGHLPRFRIRRGIPLWVPVDGTAIRDIFRIATSNGAPTRGCPYEGIAIHTVRVIREIGARP